jgi:hypothetical protein
MSISPWLMSTFVKSKPASPTPLQIATDVGRKAERADVVKYLTALATATRVEELWEAIGYILDEKHVREGVSRTL